ncbi:alpha/beta hydrolase [Arthrobacter sp. B10-11]|uniref:alpha/beta hydrolase n=1 Tax=Arthrobacter sp. B10-11 TaxID=3081160 RepID=UPI0029534852|nr:alpha/beta hydrolase [Arthrobacter sp. B10-11]MDV8147638.1 alpha/beta hydrolase [Arthrobacter sp. B10-11]
MTAGQVLRGIEFSIPGGSPLLLDLYLPGGGSTQVPVPAVVHFHGGGWRTGERSSLGPVTDGFSLTPFERLAAAGFAVVSADYRLSSEAVFPAQLLDARAAVSWLRSHAADYNVDPERIYAWGDSAGGHLACLVGLGADGSGGYDVDGSGDGGDGGQAGAARVAAVAAWYAPTDLVRMGAQALPDAVATADDPGSREALLIGARPADAPEKAAAASPLSYVGGHAPPFFLAHGTADRFVPPAQATTLAAALEASGADVELHLIEGADHMWLLPDESPAAAQKVLDATIDFFRRQARAS